MALSTLKYGTLDTKTSCFAVEGNILSSYKSYLLLYNKFLDIPATSGIYDVNTIRKQLRLDGLAWLNGEVSHAESTNVEDADVGSTTQT